MKQNPWEKLNEDSSQLTKLTPIKALLSQERVATFKFLLLSILQNILDQGAVPTCLKSYINNELNHNKIDNMLSPPPTTDHSLASW